MQVGEGVAVFRIGWGLRSQTDWTHVYTGGSGGTQWRERVLMKQEGGAQVKSRVSPYVMVL
jgi:hypothetical protein